MKHDIIFSSFACRFVAGLRTAKEETKNSACVETDKMAHNLYLTNPSGVADMSVTIQGEGSLGSHL